MAALSCAQLAAPPQETAVPPRETAFAQSCAQPNRTCRSASGRTVPIEPRRRGQQLADAGCRHQHAACAACRLRLSSQRLRGLGPAAAGGSRICRVCGTAQVTYWRQWNLGMPSVARALATRPKLQTSDIASCDVICLNLFCRGAPWLQARRGGSGGSRRQLAMSAAILRSQTPCGRGSPARTSSCQNGLM